MKKEGTFFVANFELLVSFFTSVFAVRTLQVRLIAAILLADKGAKNGFGTLTQYRERERDGERGEGGGRVD